MKKIKSLLAVAAFMVAIIGAFAFNTKSAKPLHTSTIYHYTSNSDQLADMKNISNWVAEDPSCGSTGDIPCAVEYDGDLSAFQTYLNGFSDVPTLVAAASERKSS